MKNIDKKKKVDIGGSFAWFTSSPKKIKNKFHAGTLKVKLIERTGKYEYLGKDKYGHDDYKEPKEKDITTTETTVKDKHDKEVIMDKHVNPGDKFLKEIKVKNDGNKKAWVRVKLTPEWHKDGKKFDNYHHKAPHEIDIPKLVFPNHDDWKYKDGWYYYKHKLQPGHKTSELISKVKFPGYEMGNEYQGASFTLKVEVESIQTTNGAAKAVWKVDPSQLFNPNFLFANQ